MSIKSLSWLLIGGVLLTVIFYAAILVCLTWPISEFSISRSGVFGDSFGPLTSLFSGLAFAGLIITIVMQKDELALQRQELNLTRKELSNQRLEMQVQNETLKIQRFENTFFKMLEFLELSRNEISHKYQGSIGDPRKGRDAVREIYLRFVSGYLHESYLINGEARTKFRDSCKNADGISEQFKLFNATKYGEELGQHYRTLYNLLKLIDRASFIEDKLIYANLVRAQFSRHELSLLFYNCISDFGKTKMAPLIKKYRLLKHAEPNTLPEQNLEIWREFNTCNPAEMQ